MNKTQLKWMRPRQIYLQVCSLLMILALTCVMVFSHKSSMAQPSSANTSDAKPILPQLAPANIGQTTVATKSELETPTNPEDPSKSLTYPPSSKEPVKVSIGLYVTNLADVNQTSETFDMAGYLMYNWRDPRLAFKPGPDGRTSRTASIDEIWHPALEMVNFKESSTSETSFTVQSDGTVQAQERFSKTLSSGLALQKFPFDQQILQLVMESLNYGEDTVILVADSPRIAIGTDSFVSLSEWQIGNIIGRNGKSYFSPENQYYSRVTVEVKIKRNSGFYLFKVMLPLLLITIASWSVFWIDPKEFSTQIGIAFTNLLTVVALLLVINDTLPRVGYLTFMDGFTMLCFMAILVAILELIFAHHLELYVSHGDAQKLHYKARWIVPTVFVCGNFALMAGIHLTG